MESFGTFARRLRIKARKTLKDVGNALEVTPAYVWDIEQGRRVPPVSKLENWARVLGVDAERFVMRGAKANPREGAIYLLERQLAVERGHVVALRDGLKDAWSRSSTPEHLRIKWHEIWEANAPTPQK